MAKRKKGSKVQKRAKLRRGNSAKRGKPRKNETPDRVYWYEDKDRSGQLYEYCKQDVVVTRDLYHALWQLSAEEKHIWEMDQRINDRGFHVDEKLLLAMRRERQHIVLVSDGRRPLGIVTLDDVLNAVVGTPHAEYAAAGSANMA